MVLVALAVRAIEVKCFLGHGNGRYHGAGGSTAHSCLFLLVKAVFSLYMVGFGYRSVFLKPLAGSVRVVAFDWPAAGVGLAVCLRYDGVCFPGV